MHTNTLSPDRLHPQPTPLSPDLLHRMDAYCARQLLSVGQIYLYDESAAERAADTGARETARRRTLGHDAGTELHLRALEPGHQAVHLDMFYVAGPGHGGPAIVGNVYSRDLERGVSERHPGRSGIEEAVQAVLVSRRDFQPRGADNAGRFTKGASWVSLSHAFGAAFDNPDLSSPASSATGRRKPGRWPPPGSPTSCSIPSRTEPCCPSFTSTAIIQQPDRSRPH